jgi:drug/metabolite transporter (DMT)-like permease
LLSLFTFFWGANFILAEIALDEMLPISFSVSRFAMGGIVMLAVMYVQCYQDAVRAGESVQFFPEIRKGDWGRLIAVSIFGATLAPWLGIEGLGLTHGSRASIWLALGPVLSTGLGYLLSTERLGRLGYIGIALAGIGTLVLSYEGFLTKGYWFGDLLLVVALLLTVIELHLIKPLARQYGSVSMVAMRTLIGGSLYIFIALPSLLGEPWFSFGFWTWFAIIAGGGIGVGLGQWVKVRALRSIGPTRVVIYGNLVPVATMIIAWLSVGEDPSMFEWVAGAFIVGGAFLIQVFDRKVAGSGSSDESPTS